MANYTKTTNFAAKDALASGNANKVVKGTEINTEFDNIATAVATKADLNSPTLVTPALGTPTSGVMTNVTGLPLSTGVTGTLPIANGGTGASTLASASIVTYTGTETLTNKTLTAPVISTISNTGTVTLPTSTDTLVGRATTDTLTNKTLTTPVISSLSSASATALTLQSAGTTAITIDTNQRAAFVAGTAALPAITTTGDTNTGIFFPAADTIAFAEGGAEAMRIDSSGNLLVGTTSAGGKVTIQFNSVTESGLITRPTSETYNGSPIVFKNSSDGTSGFISQSTSSVAYNTSSDYRLKEDISPITGALSKVAALKPVTYKWKVDGANGQGFIAHELAEVVPDCVSGEKDAIDADGNPKYQGIDTSFLVATLTSAIQELKAINDTQAATITALTARIVALENA